MCLLTYNARIHTLKKDMYVWKIVTITGKDTCSSEMTAFEYRRNRMVTLDKPLQVKRYLDGNAQAYDEKCIRMYVRDKNRLEKVLAVSEGFHFSIDSERLRDPIGDLQRFLVPAGAEVIYDVTGLGVSNKIMYVGDTN